MNAMAVIPARWASTRFEGKVLAEINGKPMIQHVYERVLQADHIKRVCIACDEEHVRQAALAFGADAVMTAKNHPSGSDRIAEAVQNIDVDIVVNVQGDEPLIDPRVIDDLVTVFQNNDCVMATAIKPITDEGDLNNPNIVKVVVDVHHHALYFSRAAIPFNRDQRAAQYYRHLGIYAYRKNFLLEYIKWPESKLEQTECLEQLRVLENGYKIKTIQTDMETIGVDTPEDLELVKRKLRNQ